MESAKEDFETLDKNFSSKLKDIEDNKGLSAEEKDKRRNRLTSQRTAAETALRQAENNQEFLAKLKKSVPEGVELRVTGTSGIVFLSKTKGGNALTVTYSPNDGFNFMINGKYSAGALTDRREQVEASLRVKRCWDSVVEALPEGTIVKTAAWNGDGKGEARERAYMKVGFSKGDESDGSMYSQKTGGVMRPVEGKEAYEAQERDPKSLYFSEKTTLGEEVKVWLQILTGENLV